MLSPSDKITVYHGARNLAVILEQEYLLSPVMQLFEGTQRQQMIEDRFKDIDLRMQTEKIKRVMKTDPDPIVDEKRSLGLRDFQREYFVWFYTELNRSENHLIGYLESMPCPGVLELTVTSEQITMPYEMRSPAKANKLRIQDMDTVVAPLRMALTGTLHKVHYLAEENKTALESLLQSYQDVELKPMKGLDTMPQMVAYTRGV